eukprot:NODE_197_length_15379_cov_0.485602.p4 type:complete len:414 gc:universal NODE_197_length_15379_cov_0.485602:6349-5108(-)
MIYLRKQSSCLIHNCTILISGDQGITMFRFASQSFRRATPNRQFHTSWKRYQKSNENNDNKQHNSKKPLDEEPISTAAVLKELAVVTAVLASPLLYLGRSDGSDRSFPQRISNRWGEFKGYFTNPVTSKLLPDPLEAPYQPKYTLVISLDDLLVKSEWDRNHGWQTVKRPGVDYLLYYLSQYYEVVIWTANGSHDIKHVLDKLDPYQFARFKLERDATRYSDGHYLKDISFLNRDINKIMVLDTDVQRVYPQENALQLPKWDGDRNDSILKILPFLEAVALSDTNNMPDAIKWFRDKGNFVQEFDRLKMNKYEEQMHDYALKKKKYDEGSSSIGGWLMWSLMLGKSNEPQPPLHPDEKTKKSHEFFMNRASSHVQQVVKQINTYREEMKKEEKDAANKEMSFLQMVGGEAPKE